MHVLALLARAVASARVYRELAGVAVLSDILKAAYRGPAMAEEECQDMTSDSSHNISSSTSSTNSSGACIVGVCVSCV